MLQTCCFFANPNDWALDWCHNCVSKAIAQHKGETYLTGHKILYMKFAVGFSAIKIVNKLVRELINCK